MSRKTSKLVVRVTVSVVLAMGAVFVAAWLWPQAGGVATCHSTRCFCEAVRGGVVKQPVNAISSLAFVVMAAYAWLRLRQVRASRVVQGFIVSMVIIGLGSAYYHAALSFAGQWLDVLGMYLFATLMICATLLRANIVSKKSAITLFVLINGALGATQYILPDTRRYLFALLIIIALGVEFALRQGARQMRYLGYAFGLLAIAYIIWLLDQFLIICDPTSLVQGHALWHILNACAAFFVVVHYYPKATKQSDVTSR